MLRSLVRFVLTQPGLAAPITGDSRSFELTEKGAAYLAGDLDALTLPTPTLAYGKGTARG